MSVVSEAHDQGPQPVPRYLEIEPNGRDTRWLLTNGRSRILRTPGRVKRKVRIAASTRANRPRPASPRRGDQPGEAWAGCAVLLQRPRRRPHVEGFSPRHAWG